MTIPEGRLQTLPREIRALVYTALAAEGWRGECAPSGRGHLKLYPADRSKRPIPVPGTPSDRRGLKNLRAQLRRAGLEGV